MLIIASNEVALIREPGCERSVCLTRDVADALSTSGLMIRHIQVNVSSAHVLERRYPIIVDGGRERGSVSRQLDLLQIRCCCSGITPQKYNINPHPGLPEDPNPVTTWVAMDFVAVDIVPEDLNPVSVAMAGVVLDTVFSLKPFLD